MKKSLCEECLEEFFVLDLDSEGHCYECATMLEGRQIAEDEARQEHEEPEEDFYCEDE
jgi:hypothetical protein